MVHKQVQLIESSAEFHHLLVKVRRDTIGFFPKFFSDRNKFIICLTGFDPRKKGINLIEGLLGHVYQYDLSKCVQILSMSNISP